MLIQRVACREAAKVFLLSRLVIVLVTFVGVSTFALAGQTTNHSCFQNPHYCLMAWYHWDAIAYVNVANRGYLLESRNLGLWNTGKLAHPSRLIVGVGVTNALLHGRHRAEPSYSLATKKDSTAPTTWAS